HPYFFKGDGDLHFDDVSERWGSSEASGYFNGACYADLDNDGRLDVIINAIDAPAVVLKNIGEKKNFLSLSFHGNNENTSGVGCKAYLFSGDRMQYQQLMLTRGFQSSSDSRLHFGLGNRTAVDSVLIIWPNQKYQLL